MLNKNLKISCVITLCDRENFINFAIKSILKQTYKPHEIIIIDNSFKDVSIDPEFITEVKVYKILPHAGIGQALNFGASIATGEYISFLEDDDYWIANYLEIINKKFSENYDYVVTSIDKSVNNIITKYKSPKNKLTLDNLLVSNPGVNISNLSVKKSSFYKVGGFETDLIISTDKSLIIKFIINKKIGYVCDEISTIKRFHDNQLTFSEKSLLNNFTIFYRKYKYLMNLKAKLIFLKKIIYYKFIK